MTRLLDHMDAPASRLGRELVFVLMIKLTVIGLAAVFIFGPGQRPHIDAAKVEAHLLGTSRLTTAASNTAASKTTLPKTAISQTAISKTAASRSEIP